MFYTIIIANILPPVPIRYHRIQTQFGKKVEYCIVRNPSFKILVLTKNVNIISIYNQTLSICQLLMERINIDHTKVKNSIVISKFCSDFLANLND